MVLKIIYMLLHFGKKEYFEFRFEDQSKNKYHLYNEIEGTRSSLLHFSRCIIKMKKIFR